MKMRLATVIGLLLCIGGIAGFAFRPRIPTPEHAAWLHARNQAIEQDRNPDAIPQPERMYTTFAHYYLLPSTLLLGGIGCFFARDGKQQNKKK